MIVIADDITGAAEMAGIAFNHGLAVRLCIAGNEHDLSHDKTDVLVIATDTRSMTEQEAVAETHRIVSAINCQPSSIFKKTDSALRGHVMAELAALMETAGYQRAVFLPANPSKRRIIHNGIYYIDGTPIHKTAFNYDPEFPATTSSLKKRFPEAEQKGIFMPDAESVEDIKKVIADYDDGKTIFAGAADLFESIVSRKSKESGKSGDSRYSKASTIFLCGSTQSKPLDIGLPITAMPRAIYDGSKEISLWLEEAITLYDQHGSLMITIPFHHRTGKDVAVHLREMTAELIQELVAKRQPQQLILEGGASAYATLQRLGWKQLEMVSQLAPGVIKTKAPNGTFVIMKPGSYTWGSLF